jgi:hypothetical protein
MREALVERAICGLMAAKLVSGLAGGCCTRTRQSATAVKTLLRTSINSGSCADGLWTQPGGDAACKCGVTRCTHPDFEQR